MRYLSFLSVGLLIALPVLHAQGFQGGPDGFGYYWESTQDRGDTIRFSWLDPSNHEPLAGWFPNPDDGWKRIGLPYRFPFYGGTLDSIVICSNGFLEYPVTCTNYENLSFPAPSFPCLLALFWDDLSPAQSGSIRRYDDPEHRFTSITWLNVIRFNTSETLSCQALLFANGSIRLNILRAPRTGNSCTIGIQGNSGNGGCYLQYVCNGEPVEHVPKDSTSIRFFVRRLEHDVGVLRAETPCGWLPVGSQCPVTAVFKNHGTSAETFPVSCRIVRTRIPHDTVFLRTLAISNLAPGDTVAPYFGDWLVPPCPDSWYVLLETRLAGDMLPRNDTGRFVASTFSPGFGTLLGSWDFPELGSGMNLAGITHRPDSNRFYLAAGHPNRILSFAPGPDRPVLRPEPFALQNFHGDDIIWGIAWDNRQPGFWLGHVSAYGTGCLCARYGPDGRFTGQVLDLAALVPGAWFAGIDQGPGGTMFAVAVGSGNRVCEFDPVSGQLVRQLPGPQSSYRVCSFVGDHRWYLLTGGWNQGSLLAVDFNGQVCETVPLADLADLDIYRPALPCPDSFVWAYATTSRIQNTIHRVSLGRTWRVVGLGTEVGLEPEAYRLAVRPSIVRPGQRFTVTSPFSGTRILLWDPAGRLVRTLGLPPAEWAAVDRRGLSLAPGVYVLTVAGPATKLSSKLVVMSGR